MKNCIIVFVLIFTSITGYSQNLYAGIEIGSKGLKVYVYDIKNLEDEVFELQKFWSDNIDIQRGIMYEGEFLNRDIESTSKKIVADLTRLETEYKIDKSKTFIAISSGISFAKNVNELVTKIKKTTTIDAQIVSYEIESKLMFKSCVLPKNFNESLILDLGSGNVYGGFINTVNKQQVFKSFSVNIGTMAMCELLYQKAKTYKTDEFISLLEDYKPTLKKEITEMFDSEPLHYQKKNVYLTGGATWAFFTLFNGGDNQDNYVEFKLKDVLDYDLILRTDFIKYKSQAVDDKYVRKVINTFTQENLIAANEILISTLSNIQNIEKKKLYYSKQSETTWLVPFIADNLKGKKVGSF